MSRIPRRNYTVAFKRDAVRRVEVDGEAPGRVARDLGIPEQTLGGWRRAAKANRLGAFGSEMTSAQEMEMSRLRAENARLQAKVDLLQLASNFRARGWRTAQAPDRLAVTEDKGAA